jgi:methyl-accepting chemotaxis protein
MIASFEKIDDIAVLISEIADTTKLLSLNASILAAQAGEQGEGFSVVAEEIRKLAENTERNTKEINATIKEIKENVENLVKTQKKNFSQIEKSHRFISEAGVIFEGILKISTDSSNRALFIEKAMDEQAISIKDISNSISTISHRMEEISKASAQQQTRTTEILKGLEKMKDVAKQLNKAACEQVEGARHITTTGEDILQQVKLITRSVENVRTDISNINSQVEAIVNVAEGNVKLVRKIKEESHILSDNVENLDREVSKFRINSL